MDINSIFSKVRISKDSKPKALGKLEIIVHGEHIVIENNVEQTSISLNIGFSAGQNYRPLYVSAEELNPSDNIGVKWSSLTSDEINIDNISINFMSNYMQRFVL